MPHLFTAYDLWSSWGAGVVLGISLTYLFFVRRRNKQLIALSAAILKLMDRLEQITAEANNSDDR